MNGDEGPEAFALLERLGVEVRDPVLYVGWHPQTFDEWGGQWFLEHIRNKLKENVRVTVVEVDPDRCRYLRAHPYSKRHRFEVVNCSLQEYRERDKFGLSIWWHGPEHVPENELSLSLSVLETATKSGGAVILGGPLGHDPSTTEGDIHYYDLTREHFTTRGYSTSVVSRSWKGRKVTPHINAIKAIE